MKLIKNVPALVRQRLLDRSRTDLRPFNELLQYYAIEGFLYRFSLSAHLNRFILKGALMLRRTLILHASSRRSRVTRTGGKYA